MMTERRTREQITESREREIVELIENWNPEKKKLTREELVRRVGCKMGLKITRQGLMKRDAIRLAFVRREKEINGDKPPRAEADPLEVVLEKRIEELQAKLKTRDEEIVSYKNLFTTYRYNARQLGITREQLEAPIPSRNQSEGSRG